MATIEIRGRKPGGPLTAPSWQSPMRFREPPPIASPPSNSPLSPLIDPERHEAQIAAAVDQEQDRFAPGLARLFHALGEVVRGLHFLLGDFDDHVAGLDVAVA